MANVIDMQHIQALMKERNLSLGDMAKLTGLSKSYLSLMFSGKRNTSIKNLNKIIEALDADVAITQLFKK